MLAGEPPFTGASAQAVVAKVMTEDAAPLTRASAAACRRTSKRPSCTALEKVPADRFPTADAFAAALADESPIHFRPGSRSGPVRLQSWRAAALAAGALTVVAALAWQIGRMSPARRLPEVQRPVRFTIELDSLALHNSSMLALSPDGQTLVFAAEDTEGTRLYARRLDDLAARPLAGTEEAEHPFLSPDGAWVAFFSNGALRKVRVDGGAPVVVAEIPPSSISLTGSWGLGDTLVYASSGALYRVPAAGGAPSRVMIADTSLLLLHPHVLPGGRAVLVTVTPDYNVGYLGVVDLATGGVRQFGPGIAPQFAAGHLVYGSIGGELYRQPFDLERLEPTGEAEQISNNVGMSLGGIEDPGFAAAAAGALAYHVTSFPVGSLSLIITDHEGREERVLPSRWIWAPRFSPDGRLIAHGGLAPGRDSSDLWITDVASGTTQRLTRDGNDNNDADVEPGRPVAGLLREAPEGKDVFVRAVAGGDGATPHQPPRLSVADRLGARWEWAVVHEHGSHGRPTRGCRTSGCSRWTAPRRGHSQRRRRGSRRRGCRPTAAGWRTSPTSRAGSRSTCRATRRRG